MSLSLLRHGGVAIAMAIAIAPLSLSAAQEDHKIGSFSTGELSGWKEKVFKGQTQYNLTPSGHGMVLHADSQGTASAFYKDVQIDLTKTPCLNWSWHVDNVLEGLQETTKAGDDYSARIYVVVSGGLAFWNTRAMNYVWSGTHPVGASWPNAFTKQSFNVVVQSGSKDTGKWLHYSRDVRKDFSTLMGKDFLGADGVAIMTDSDNSGRSATANFGDIYFSETCL